MQTYSQQPTTFNPTQYPQTGIWAQKVQQAIDSKQHHRWIQRITNNLAFALKIPEGDHLTFILGYGECFSNHQALYAWVEEQMSSYPILDKSQSEDLFYTLKQQLHDHLNLHLDNMMQGDF